jgi:enoyl-CoA hydratase/carnithine racemase
MCRAHLRSACHAPRVPYNRAMETILTGKLIDAEQAYKDGLLNRDA